MIKKGIQLSRSAKRIITSASIWIKNPDIAMYNYPNWDPYLDELDVLTKRLFSTRQKYNYYRRSFRHKCYTMYKTKAIVHVTKNGHKKRVRYYGLVKSQSA